MSKFQILAGGQNVNILSRSSDNIIAFDLYQSLYEQVNLFLKAKGETKWERFYHYEREDNEYKSSYRVTLPADLPPNYYSLKISLIASENDSVINTIDPAFYVGGESLTDSLALVDFYLSTGGKNWTDHSNWLQTKMENWKGVQLEEGRVVSINLPSNNLKGALPSSLINLSKLRTLTLNGNYLDEVGDLTLLTSLTNVNISNNQLTFNDIIPNLSIESLSYSPQKKLGKEQIFRMIENDRLEINTNFGEEGSHYYWYKDFRRFSNVDEQLITFDAVSETDEGSYWCFILNEYLPGLTLETSPFVITVDAPLFTDKSYLLDDLDTYTYGASWIDFDNDGDQDLFIVNHGSSNQLLKNMFVETDSVWFADVTETAMGLDKGSSAVSTWGDINNDGYIDAFVVNQDYTDPKIIYLNNGDGTFRELNDPLIQAQLRYSQTASWVDQNNDGYLDLFIGNSYHYQLSDYSNQIFMNRGDLTFESNPDPVLKSGNYYQSASWFDIDNDLDQDAFISGYGLDLVLINDEGTFKWPNNEDYTWFWTQVNGLTNSVGDFDNDGDLDVFSGHGGWYFEFIKEPNNLLLENINGTLRPFQDSSLAADETNYFSSSWGDYDNDGDLDLLGTSFYGITNLWSNQLQETGTVSFKKIDYGATSGYLMGSRGCSFADFDNDGDLDIFVAGSQFENYLFENVVGTKNNWINMKCVGVQSNKSAIGARVKVKANINGKPGWQMREISSQTGYSGQNSLNVEFGLGNATVIDSVKIYWPSGTYWDTTNVQINQFIEFIEHEKPNDLPQIMALNDTIIFENVPFSKTYNIKDDWNKGINVTVSKLPSWLKFQYNNRMLNLSGLPNDYSPGDYQLIFSVDDGFIDKPVKDTLNIQVVNVNDPPIIFGQGIIEMPENGVLIFEVGMMQCFDIDNDLSELSVRIHDGDGYTVRADSILLNQNYFNNLSVPIQLFDGELYSDTFDVEIVNRFNDIPCLSLTDHHLYAVEDEYFETEFQVVDSRFSKIEVAELNRLGWLSCTLENQTIKLSGTPENNDTGFYTYVLELDDGYLNHPIKDTLYITVENVNDAPVITGQHPASFDVDGRFNFSLDYLQVEDVDNEYPIDFGFSMQAGNNYRLEGNSIFYTNTDNSQVILPVQVHDGFMHSNTWNFTIEKTSNSFEPLDEQIELYPIPFVNELHLVVPTGLKVNSFSFYNVTGQRIYPEVIEENHQYLIDFTGLSQEFILMNIVLNDKVFTKKLMRKQN
jgi:enediyne biosynthesis protein E4